MVKVSPAVMREALLAVWFVVLLTGGEMFYMSMCYISLVCLETAHEWRMESPKKQFC